MPEHPTKAIPIEIRYTRYIVLESVDDLSKTYKAKDAHMFSEWEKVIDTGKRKYEFYKKELKEQYIYDYDFTKRDEFFHYRELE